MKKIILLIISLFIVNILFSQILYDEGIVKGKNVTYEVKRGKGHLKSFTFIRNVNNPDTTFREVPNHNIIPPQMVDINMQVAEIIHDGLSPKELAQIYRSALIGMTFRVDAKKKELMQETLIFYFCDEPFWANFSPDRLHDLEQLILRKLKLPSKLQKIYVEADFFVFVYGSEIQNIEETRETRRKAIEAWKQKDFKVEVRPWPKFVIKEKQDEE